MKYIRLIIIAISLFSISCMRVDEGAKTRCYIGRVKISKQSYLGSYNVYVSLNLINNTNDTLFLPSSDSIGLFPQSAFVGRLAHHKIEFFEGRSRSKILPKDSIYVRLISTYYKPKTNDSVFIREIQKITIEYEYPNSNKQTSSKYIKEIHVQRTSKTRFEILEENKSIEGIFLFGNEEFK